MTAIEEEAENIATTSGRVVLLLDAMLTASKALNDELTILVNQMHLANGKASTTNE